MKQISLIILLFISFQFSAFSQSATDKLKALEQSHDYVEASGYIKSAIKENPKDVKLIVLCGDIYTEVDKLDSALIVYNIAKDVKSSALILRKIAKTQSKLGNHKDAVETIQQAIKNDKADVYCQLDYGMILIAADSINQAELVISKAREMNKNIPDAYLALGELYYAQQIYELARTNFESALKLDENLIEARIKLATTYYQMGIREQDEDLRQNLLVSSLKEWNTITTKDPKNARAFYEQGRLFFFASKYVEAAQSFNQYIQLRPNNSLAKWYLAQSLYEIGKCEEAAPYLRAASNEIDSVKFKAMVILGRCYFQVGKSQECIATFKSLRNVGYVLEEKNLDMYARSNLAIGDTIEAMIAFKELVNRNPQQCDLLMNLGQLSRLVKNYEDAIFFFSKRLENCKNSNRIGKTLFYIGTSYLSLEKPDTAMIFIKKAIEEEPNDILSYVYQGDVYSKLGQNDSSKISFKLAIEKGAADTSAQGRNFVNQAYAKLCGIVFDEKNYKELLKISTEWSQFDPNYSFAFLYLGIANQGLEDKDAACRNYRKVIQLDPKNKPAQEMVKKLGC